MKNTLKKILLGGLLGLSSLVSFGQDGMNKTVQNPAKDITTAPPVYTNPVGSGNKVTVTVGGVLRSVDVSLLNKTAIDNLTAALANKLSATPSLTTLGNLTPGADNIPVWSTANGGGWVTSTPGAFKSKLGIGITDVSGLNTALADKLSSSGLATVNGIPLTGGGNVVVTGEGGDTVAYVTARQFGAKGDGVTNDASQLNLALVSGARRIVLEKFKVYFILSRLRIPSGVTLDLNGATIRPGGTLSTSSDGVIRSMYDNDDVGFETGTLTTTVDVKKGRHYFVYTGASNFRAGDMVNVAGGGRHTTENYTYYYGWYTQIVRTSNDTVYLASAADTTFAGTSIKSYKTHVNMHLTNGTIDMSGSAGAYGVVFDHAVNSSITNLIIKGNLAPNSVINQAVQLSGLNSHVSHNWIYGGGDSNTPGASAYGVQVVGVSITVDHNYIQGFKHGIACGGQRWFASNLIYEYNTVVGDWSNAAALDFHANVMSGKMLFNKIVVGRRASVAVNIRCKNVLFMGNEVTFYHNGSTTSTAKGIDFDEIATDNIKVVYNEFIAITESTTPGNDGNIIGVSGNCDFPMENITVEFNTFRNCGISLNKLGRNIKVRNNEMFGSPYRPIYIELVNGNALYCEISKNYIEQNILSNVSHYTIRVGSTAKYTTVAGNVVRLTYASNAQDPIRVDGDNSYVYDNDLYMEPNGNSGGIRHYSAGKANWVYNNRRIKADGTILLVTGYGSTLPSASSFFEGRRILLGNTESICLKSAGSGTYSWITTVTAP